LKNLKLFLSVSFLLIYSIENSFAQNFDNLDSEPKSTEEQLAVKYYQEKDFEKAAFYYEKLFNKKNSPTYYRYLLNSLLELEDYKKAKKIVKQQQKTYPENYGYKVDFGFVTEKESGRSKALKEYQSLIENLGPIPQDVSGLAEAFKNKKEYDLAIETYLKGRKSLKGVYDFNFEMADIYYEKKEYGSFVNELLDVLEENPAYIQQVQNQLVLVYDDADESKRSLLKTQLLKRTQKSLDKNIFPELLIWVFTQEKNFDGALNQAIAMQKRQKNDGARVYNLSESAANNGSFDVAVKGYKFLIENLEKNNAYYQFAKINLPNVYLKRITDQGNYTNDELLDLEKIYLNTISEMGTNNKTGSLQKSLAHLYAFYLDNSDEAIKILERTIKIPNMSPQLVAECKLELGDILLMNDDEWEASLYYGQVDKDFKYDPIGDEAKLRNAKLSYYTGEFKWAQAQLDVLKGSTSKLISNDAIELSLLISDNTIIDTNTTPLILFAKADLLIYRNRLDQALLTLDTINTFFPGHSLEDDILMRKYEIAIKRKDFNTAVAHLEQISKAHSTGVLADKALFLTAQLYEYNLNNKETAQTLYKQLMVDFPGSLFVTEARKRFRILRGDEL
jgi:outer membrane protein assembly factor BamD (BamD/ComL family)